MPYFESLSAYMCMARPESVLHARVKRVNFTANHLRGALPMDSTIPMLSFFIFFKRKVKLCSAEQSITRPKPLHQVKSILYPPPPPPPPLYVMPMLAGTGPNGPQTPPLSLHSVRLVQTCNVHLKHTQFVLFCYCY